MFLHHVMKPQSYQLAMHKQFIQPFSKCQNASCGSKSPDDSASFIATLLASECRLGGMKPLGLSGSLHH